jgi:hypothetical protein
MSEADQRKADRTAEKAYLAFFFNTTANNAALGEFAGALAII